MCLPSRGSGACCGLGGRGQPLRHCSWWGSKSWASASPRAGHAVKQQQQLSAGLSLSHSPISQSCGAFWSLTVLIQDTEGYSNKLLRLLTFWATTEKLACGREGYLSEIARRWEEAVLAVGFSSPAEWRKTEVVDFLICKTFLSWISCVETFICSPAPTAVPVLLQALCTQVWRSFCTSQNISVKGQ